jgi:hypothetical protein
MEIRVEQLVGRKVRALDGSVCGRIEEIVAVRQGVRRVVAEIHLGPAAILERLAAPFVDHARGWRVTWDQIDLSDPEKPKLRVPISEVMPLVKTSSGPLGGP